MTSNKLIEKIVLIVAMEIEANPLVTEIGMRQVENIFDERLPIVTYQANSNKNLFLVFNGKCPINGCDRIGTQASALTAWEVIKVLDPDLIINVGTSGGFKKRGANIGDVFLSSDIKYHHRQTPAPGFSGFLIGKYNCLQPQKIAMELGLKVGVISSGDSVYANQSDLKQMELNKTDCKEMEAAAIAEVALLAKKDILALKVITDYVDMTECTNEQFKKNYAIAINNLKVKTIKLLDYLKGKTFFELQNSLGSDSPVS